MSDHTTAVAGTRAHTLTHALAATSFHHRNPVAYPAKVGEVEDFSEAAFAPFLRRPALVKEWAQLLEHARRVDACRETGQAWGYTC